MSLFLYCFEDVIVIKGNGIRTVVYLVSALGNSIGIEYSNVIPCYFVRIIGLFSIAVPTLVECHCATRSPMAMTFDIQD